MPDRSDAELEEEQEGEDEGDSGQKQPPRRRSRKAAPKKRAPGDAEEAAEEANEEDEDLLPEAVIPPSRGGSSGLLAVIVILIVAVLVAGVWWQYQRTQENAQAQRRARLAVAASQMATIQDRVEKALAELDQPEPDVDRAIAILNEASENVSVLAQGTSQIEGGPELSDKLLSVQASIRQTTQELEDDQARYEETVRAAREKARDELKLSTTRRVRPITDRIGVLVSHYAAGDTEAPIIVPTPPAPDTDQGDEEQEPAPPADAAETPANEGEAGSAEEAGQR